MARAFRRGGWKDTHARMNAEIKRKYSFFSCRLSLHLFTFWLHDLYARMLSQFQFFTRRTQNAKGVFRRKALTISTHRTSFSRFWRSIFLQLLVINRFIDEYAIRMYACFTRMIYIATYCPSQQSREKEKKGRRKNALFFIYATVHAVHARENWIQKSRAEEHEEKVTRIISRARTTNERHRLLLLCTRCCIRHTRLRVSRPDRWDFPEPFLACINYDVTLVRFDYAHLHARTLTRTHTRY
jgi:hypothetical protein